MHRFASHTDIRCPWAQRRGPLVFLFALCLGLFCAGRLNAQTPGVGAVAPPFTLSTPTGTQVQLRDELQKGTVALVVLRGFAGYQCPYCLRQVHDFVDHASQFAARRTEVVLVYPGPSANLGQHAMNFLAQQAALPPIVVLVLDPDYVMTNTYGLRWNAEHETAYPATFLLDPTGRVLYEKVSHSHGDRTSAEEVLNQLASAKQP